MGIDSASIFYDKLSMLSSSTNVHGNTIRVNYYSVYVQLIITMNRVIPYLYLDIRT